MRDVEVYIKKRGQAEFALSSVVSKDFHVLTAYMNSPQITPSYETMAGSDGGRLTNIVFNQTTFTIECFINGRQKSDFRLMRDEVYRHFYSREAVQVRTSLEPSKAVYVVPKPVDIISEKGYSGVAFNLQFDVLEGYRHTPYRSDELSTNQSKLQYGMGLDIENLPIYNFKANDFVVNNPSDMAIDPYIHRHDLKWIIRGTSDGIVTVKNTTNGTSFATTGKISNSFTLDGITGSQAWDWGHIVLDKGQNTIKVTGLKSTDITVSFPFLYF